MESSRMNEIYHDIASKVNDLIPVEWEKVFLYGEVLYDSERVFFYFVPKANHELVYSLDIWRKYNIERSTYKTYRNLLYDSIFDLHNEYKKHYEKIWTNLTLILENTGKFSIEFNYDDIYNSVFNDIERHLIWKYEVMDIVPELEEHKEIIERYLKTKEV